MQYGRGFLGYKPRRHYLKGYAEMHRHMQEQMSDQSVRVVVITFPFVVMRYRRSIDNRHSRVQLIMIGRYLRPDGWRQKGHRHYNQQPARNNLGDTTKHAGSLHQTGLALYD